MNFNKRSFLTIIVLVILFNADLGARCSKGKLSYLSLNSVQEKMYVKADSLYKVLKIIDGDTFWVQNSSRRFKVRLIGVDAPETRNSQYKKRGYYAEEAKEFVRRLTEDKFVRLEYDVQTIDRYQRDLAYVYLEDGTFLNAVLLRSGYAIVATFPPNVRYTEYFLKLQREARDRKVGLWVH